MKNINRILLGVALLAIGIIFILNTAGVTDVDVWFSGWWTLFIIIPNLVGIFTEKNKVGNAFGLGIGILLLLCAQNVLEYDIIWKLLLPLAMIAVAIKLIIGGFKKKKPGKAAKIGVEGETHEGTVIFGAREMRFDGQVFEGCELNVIFGGIECDLRGAIIERDCHIKATAIFGGVDIILPKNVNIHINSTSVFGGVEGGRSVNPDATVTVYVDSTAIFGGVDIK